MPQDYGFDPNLPPELAAEQGRLARRRRIADLLMQHGMQPVQSTNPRAPVSWTQGLAQILHAYQGGRAMEDVDRGEKAIGQRYQQGLADEVRRVVQMRSGAPASSETIVDEEAAGGEGAPATINAPAVQGDPRAAVMAALTSQYGPVREMGKADYAQLAKQGPQAMLSKIDPKDYTPDSFATFMATGNPAALRPRVKKEITPSGQVYDPYSVQQTDIKPDPNKPFSIGPDGKPLANQPYQDYDKSARAASAPQVSVNTADNPFLRGLGEASAKAFETGATQARGALDTIGTVHQIRSALDTSGLQLGPTTKAQLFLSRIGEKFVGATATEQEKLSKARQIIQGQAQLELDAAKQMKGQGQITEAEREIIRRASSGDVDNMSNSEMRSLLDTLEKMSRIKIKAHNTQLDAMRKQKNISPMVLSPFDVQMPPEYKSPSAGGRSALSPETEELLNRFAPVGGP